MRLATNAQAIHDARMRGQKPDGLILVSLIGQLQERNHTVIASTTARYCWRWTVGLYVCVFINHRVDWKPAVRAIAESRPARLYLWDTETQRGCNVYLIPAPDDIGKPVSQWKRKLDFLSWLDCENGYFNENNHR